MGQVDFAYRMAADAAGLPLEVSIYGDRARLRQEWREDVEAAGMGVRECAGLDGLAQGAPRALADLVLVDCPEPDAAAIAALARLDERAARSGARLLVTTGLDGLDAVFGACAEGEAQILVNPSRPDRVLALGRALAEGPRGRVRELSQEDRLLLLRLSEQVNAIADRIERFGAAPASAAAPGPAAAAPSAFAFESAAPAAERLVRQARPPLPDPRLVRKIIQQRQLRARFLDGDLFADPAWDMLLDLTAARVEHVRVSVTSLCIASGVPPTTALRWISQMTEAGLLERVEDETDRRRAFIQLTDKAADAMARYFADIARQGAQVI